MTMSNEMTGGEALARSVQAHGNPPMFGMGGFQLLPFYDAIRRLGLRHTLINDERTGAFAADAYARVSGRVGVCDATLGPGATNLVTGLVESLNAGTPVVAFIGDTNRAHSWKNMTQESRQLEILRPAVKEVIRIERTERIPELVRRAFHVAAAGRPGPVVVDVPEDVAHDAYPFEPEAFEVPDGVATIPAFRIRPGRDALEHAVRLLREAERPIVLAGGGVHLSGAAETLQAFAEATATPVAHTLSGKGAIACSHDLSAGIFGRYSRIANDLIEEADLILVVGCKLGEIATKRYTVPPPGKTLVHLEIDPTEIGRCYPATVGLWGDARAGIEDLGEALAGDAPRLRQDREGWARGVRERMARWREETHSKISSDEVPVAMGRLMAEMRKALPEDGLLIADGGFAAHWGGLLFDTERPGRTFVPDRGFASIGYGLPGAMGAKLAAPERPVVALTGDGGFNMTLGDLETARRLGLGIAIVVVNNEASGYVKALQHLMYGAGAYQSSDLAPTDYARVAEALGCRGIRVDRPEDLGTALGEALDVRGLPVVVDVAVTTDPADMLPGVDSRTAPPTKGDRVA
jgi:acetolactate synthase-1/2/3 large subunit